MVPVSVIMALLSLRNSAFNSFSLAVTPLRKYLATTKNVNCEGKTPVCWRNYMITGRDCLNVQTVSLFLSWRASVCNIRSAKRESSSTKKSLKDLCWRVSRIRCFLHSTLTWWNSIAFYMELSDEWHRGDSKSVSTRDSFFALPN